MQDDRAGNFAGEDASSGRGTEPERGYASERERDLAAKTLRHRETDGQPAPSEESRVEKGGA